MLRNHTVFLSGSDGFIQSRADVAGWAVGAGASSVVAVTVS